MAPQSSDMKPPAPNERGNTSIDPQQQHPQMAAPESPAKMSPARDTADGTGATTNKDVKHADPRSSKAKKIPTLEAPDDITSITNEKHQPISTPVSSVERSDLVDKATDGTPPDPDSPSSGNLLSSTNKRDSLDDPAGTRPSPQLTSHDAESTSSGKTSLIPTNANDISSTDGSSAYGSAAVSLEDNSKADAESHGTSTSRMLKRKLAAPTDEQLPEAQSLQQSSKKMKPTINSPSPTATESATIDSGSAASASKPATNTAATQGNASAVATTPAQTQTSTHPVAAQGSNPAVSTTSTQTGTPANVATTQGNASAVPPTSTQTQNPTIAHNIATPQAPTTQIPPIDLFIAHLRQVCGNPPRLWIESLPPAGERKLGMEKRINKLNFQILALSAVKISKLNKPKLCRWLASNDVLPTLNKFKEECLDNLQVHAAMLNFLVLSDSPWKALTELIASCAKNYDEIVSGTIQFTHPHRPEIMRCARFVRRLVRESRANITYYLDECAFPDMDRFLHELCVRALLTAYYDYLSNADGFFSTLFSSSFRMPMTSEARKLWKEILGFNRAVPDAEYRTPSLVIHRVVNAFGQAMKPRTMQKTNSNDDKLIVKDGELEMASRFTHELKELETEADSHPGLLLAMNSGPALNGPNRSNILPTRIVDHMSVCTQCIVRSAQPDRQLFEKHRLTGLIVPASKISAASNNADPFTNEEKLAFFLRFKAVHAAPAVTSLDEVPLTPSAISLMKWAAIAEVLPGRGIADCIGLYHQYIHLLRYAQV